MKTFLARSTWTLAIFACSCSGDPISVEATQEGPGTEKETALLKSPSTRPAGRKKGPEVRVKGFVVGDTEISVFSEDAKPLPEMKLSEEAAYWIERFGGELIWHAAAPGGGQWEYVPPLVCDAELDQYDHDLSTAVVLVGVALDARCRICERRGATGRACTDEQLCEIERLYYETEVRLGRPVALLPVCIQE